MMTSLPHRLDRVVVIHASRDTVFRFFTDTARWAAWWGAGSTIDPRPGGRVHIRLPGNVDITGEVLEIQPPDRIVFTYGYETGTPIPAGGSRVTLRLEPLGDSTRLRLAHEFADQAVRDEHVQGWRYQLSLFGNVVADQLHANAAAMIDAWFQAWSEPDVSAREAVLARVTIPMVRFQDRFSLVEGAAEIAAQLGAFQRFMPGLRPARKGDIRHCQGTALVDWVALASDGREQRSGTSVFTLGTDGRIESVTGFWNVPARSG